jgi:hypothetical protein
MSDHILIFSDLASQGGVTYILQLICCLNLGDELNQGFRNLVTVVFL